MATSHLQIAIDGPVASGKGTVAAILAKQLGLLYVNTGSMYRALALACIREHIDLNNEEQVLIVLKKSDIQIAGGAHKQNDCIVTLNGEDVSQFIITVQIGQATPKVARIPQVRQLMVIKQQEIAANSAVVMEGRDIGLRVLPQAQLKIYLTGSLDIRVQRRYEQFRNKGIVRNYEEVLEDTKKRDFEDSTRKSDPLQKLPDAWELDTTHLTQEEVVEKIETELRKRKLI